MASPVAFSITWVQLDILREMADDPEVCALNASTERALLSKGLVRDQGDGLVITGAGRSLCKALAGLAVPKRHS